MLKEFEKFGVINIKNFFDENEIKTIQNRTLELFDQKVEFIYDINKEKINNSFLSKKNFSKLKDKLLIKCDNKSLKLKSLENFIDFISPLLKENREEEKLLAELNEIFVVKTSIIVDFLFDDIYSTVFLSDKVLNIYRELLKTNELIYAGESSVSYNKIPIQGWHSDDQQNYTLNQSVNTFQIRGGVYFDSNGIDSGGTKFVRGSHFYVSPSKLLKKIIKRIIRNENFNNSIFNTRILISKNFYPTKKDFCLWDKRIIHSPWALKMKKFPNISLRPFLEKHLLKQKYLNNLFEKKSFPRSLASLDFAINGNEFNRYIENLNNRSDYNNYFKSKEYILKKDFIAKLSNKNILLNTKCFDKHLKNN
jgi:hypothetical protein